MKRIISAFMVAGPLALIWWGVAQIYAPAAPISVGVLWWIDNYFGRAKGDS